MSGGDIGGIVGGLTFAAFGLPPSTGFLIGSTIGNLIDPPSTPGAAIGDLSVTSNTFGKPIPICYGSIRVAGNIIWARPLKAVQVSVEQGGKGAEQVILGGGMLLASSLSPGQTSTTYEYYANFAIGLCEGETDEILRIWANNAIIYDVTKEGQTQGANLRFRYYRGTEDQLPDGLIQSSEGLFNTPAFRGLAYIVFEDLPLADFGNSIPNIQVEVIQKRTEVAITTPLDTNAPDLSFITTKIDHVYGYQYFLSGSSSYTIYKADTDTMKIVSQGVFNNFNGSSVRIIAASGDTLVITSIGGGNSRPIKAINTETMQIVASGGKFSSSVGGVLRCDFDDSYPAINASSTSSELVNLGNSKYLVVRTQVRGDIWVFEVNSTTGKILPVYASNITEGENSPAADASYNIICKAEEGFVSSTCYVVATEPNYQIKIRKITINGGARLNRIGDDDTDCSISSVGVTNTEVGSFNLSQIFTSLSGGSDYYLFRYDYTDGNLIYMFENNGITKYFKTRPNGEILWVKSEEGESSSFAVTSTENNTNFRISNGRILVTFTQGGAKLLDTITGEWVTDTEHFDVFYGFTRRVGGFDSSTNTAYFTNLNDPYSKYAVFRGVGGSIPLSEVISDLCLRVGINETDIDVTDISAENVKGIAFSQQGPVKNYIQTLQNRYLFDGVESDYILKFGLRTNRTVLGQILANDLVRNDEQDLVTETRVQEIEIPRTITLSYLDKDKDYQVLTQSASRVRNPIPTIVSDNRVDTELPMVGTADEIRQTAEIQLYTSWVERSTYNFFMPWRYLKYDPADLVNLNLPDGTVFETRITEIDLGLTYSIEVSGKSNQPGQFQSTISGSSGLGFDPTSVIGVVPSRLFVMETPYFRDIDAGQETLVLTYFGMVGIRDVGWTGGQVFNSIDGVNFNSAGFVTAPLVLGTVVDPLGSVEDIFATDYVNTLTVFLSDPDSNSYSSISDEEFYNGGNLALYMARDFSNPEIISFKNATQNADGSYTLDTLTRGRRGTSYATNNHTSSNGFLIMLNENTISAFTTPLSQLNTELFFSAVSNGQSVIDGTRYTLDIDGAPLKPYAPSNLKAEFNSSDIDISWIRCTRLGNVDLPDGFSTLPLSEEIEEYELVIYDSTGVNPVRTITGLTSPNYTYTQANQISDGYVDPTNIIIELFQMSRKVGRGFGIKKQVNIY